MKKLYLSILAGALGLSLLTACGGKTETAPTKESTTATSEAAKNEETTSESTTAGTDAKIDSDGIFTVGFDKNFPPMGFVGDNGEFTGFDLELAAEAAKRMGLEIKYQPIEWDAKDMELNSGTIDVIWNGFTMNGREEAYLWTSPYMENSQIFVVSKSSGIGSLADLSGKIVEVQADSSAEAALKDMPELTASFSKLVTTPDYNTAFMDLESGAVDAIAMDIVVAGYQIGKRGNDEFIILDEKLVAEQYGIGLAKSNTVLRDALENTLKDMAKDGKMAEISTKWFGKDLTTIK